MKQALAKNFAKKFMNNPNKLANDAVSKQSLTDLRNEFLLYLAKVYDNATREEGVKGCHRVISTNSNNPQVLRVVLGALCDRSS